jgi:hypothetical protein
MRRYNRSVIFYVTCCILLGTGIATASNVESVYDTCWNPPNVMVDSLHPYYFPLTLPGWDLDKANYQEATFNITYVDQSLLNIYIYAADPATDTSKASSYNILLGTVPYWTKYCPLIGKSGTAQFDLLAALDTNTFNALFKGQDTLYVVSDCHYIFDKASLHLETVPGQGGTVPIPPSILLLGSGLLGLLGFRRGSIKG